ncbi:hypothetical protein DMI77_00865 [Akkermansia muciniphila]|uniref:Uncharacterized protein n=1 Tax=Akkermansia massiliensis TaxID=2927224 RepID=A0AAE6T9G0_9BACT|nr:hypothetical protein [Akkermansia massiliensis]QHV62015.1 hypothetical protein DMI76_00865 [Akkermansia massiliensis]QHV74382.1 hypothetical protein DMI75_00865 [Akkermansia massiliensis]QUY58338.1 hypothetical protein DMI77_00865 [Akkermansia muciniphila]
MTNKQDFGGAENGNSDELTRGNNGIDSLASGDAGAILTPADLDAFDPGRVYKIVGASPIEPATSKKAATPWYLSRTFYVNLAALLSLLVPSVREWLENNPVDFVTALGGLNILLRFVTYGKHQISSDDDSESGTGDGTGNELESRPLPGNNDLANSSIAGAGTSNPSKLGTIKRKVLLTIGALMVLLGGSCSSESPAPTSVSLSEGQAVIVRGGSSLVIDRENHSLSWAQDMPDVVIAPAVVQVK